MRDAAAIVADAQLPTAAEPILIPASMKMQIEIEAPAVGTVRRITVAEGDSVAEGPVIVTLQT